MATWIKVAYQTGERIDYINLDHCRQIDVDLKQKHIQLRGDGYPRYEIDEKAFPEVYRQILNYLAQQTGQK